MIGWCWSWNGAGIVGEAPVFFATWRNSPWFLINSCLVVRKCQQHYIVWPCCRSCDWTIPTDVDLQFCNETNVWLNLLCHCLLIVSALRPIYHGVKAYELTGYRANCNGDTGRRKAGGEFNSTRTMKRNKTRVASWYETHNQYCLGNGTKGVTDMVEVISDVMEARCAS